MKKQINHYVKAHLVRGAFYTVLLLVATLLSFFRPEAPAKFSQRTLSFAERVAYQRAIEEVYWHHRIWPKSRPDPKPPLDAVMSQAQLQKKVTDYLRNSQMLEEHWQRPITAEQLQGEMERMGRNTKQPEVLRELFEALGNDPSVIAECLARPGLTERLVADLSAHDKRQRFALPQTQVAGNKFNITTSTKASYTLPQIDFCIDDTWTSTTLTNAPAGRDFHTAVWTGSEMIVWGGNDDDPPGFNTGGKYNPSTDSWTATSTTNAPTGRYDHTVVWTGSEMIVWGGLTTCNQNCYASTGGRYSPGTDSWVATSTTNAPEPRSGHTAVWTGSEMIVWGGYGDSGFLNSGGRYNPSTNSWTMTTMSNAPEPRGQHTAVWTGSEMIVWGGSIGGPNFFNTGGRYNPATDSWMATTTTNAPTARYLHTAVWTGSEMIIWGGAFGPPPVTFDTGGRYHPDTDSWTATTTTFAPEPRFLHTAVWTGSEMIIWGGLDLYYDLSTGARYNPSNDSWRATSTTNAPLADYYHTAVWSGSEMIVWGGELAPTPTPGRQVRGRQPRIAQNTGGRYCAQSASPTPTPTATATGTPIATPTTTATATATATPTPRFAPTPRSRPTPPPRP